MNRIHVSFLILISGVSYYFTKFLCEINEKIKTSGMKSEKKANFFPPHTPKHSHSSPELVNATLKLFSVQCLLLSTGRALYSRSLNWFILHNWNFIFLQQLLFISCSSLSSCYQLIYSLLLWFWNTWNIWNKYDWRSIYTVSGLFHLVKCPPNSLRLLFIAGFLSFFFLFKAELYSIIYIDICVYV